MRLDMDRARALAGLQDVELNDVEVLLLVACAASWSVIKADHDETGVIMRDADHFPSVLATLAGMGVLDMADDVQ